MTALSGKRESDGKLSPRTKDNTGPRKWLVVEFDFARAEEGTPRTPSDDILDKLAAELNPRTAPDLCAAILLHLLAEGAPLTMAVHSGGKSLHGWFPVHGASDDELLGFFNYFRQFNCDEHTWVPCQLIRVPNGTRSNGRRQMVHYLNPFLLPAA